MDFIEVQTTNDYKKIRRKFLRRNAKWGYLFILPAFLFLLVFSYSPLILSVIRSFTEYSTGKFVGFKNFTFVLKTPAFVKSLRNVLVLSSAVVILQTVFSFLMAQLIYSVPKKLGNAVKIAIYIPNMMSGVITAIIFNLLLRYNRGLFDGIMIALNLDPIYFAQDGYWPFLCIVIPTIWLGFGYNSILMLSGRLSIPREYYEAARIYGASAFKQMTSITIPNMANYFILMIVNLITANLQMLELPMFITGGGPNLSTITPAMYIFQSFGDAMRDRNISIAGSLLIMVPIGLLNILAFSLIKSKRSED